MIPADLSKKYGLSEDETASAVETAIARVLSGAFGMDVVAQVGRTVEVVALPLVPTDDRGEEPVALEALSGRIKRQIRYHIERELERRQVAHEFDGLIGLRGCVVTGKVIHVSPRGELTVEIELADHFRRLFVTGTCPARHLSPHERRDFGTGRVAAFFVARVMIVSRKGAHRVHVGLSRTARAFPAVLLQERAEEPSVRCRRRVCGAFSLLETERRLPREAILAVGHELRERIIVRVLAKKAL